MSGLTGAETGTRVHWLLFDKDTWKILDEAGYAYDSTFGYNDDVGFRAGTMQPYRPRGCGRLVEVPLIIQDGGLFGGKTWNSSDDGGRGACLCLDEEEAMRRCEEVLAYAKQYGGVVTLLWHQVSMAAPKGWGDYYKALVEKVVADGAWVAPVEEVMRWYEIRRKIVLHLALYEKEFFIQLNGLVQGSDTANQKLRIHLNPSVILNIDTEYQKSKFMADVNGGKNKISVHLQ